MYLLVGLKTFGLDNHTRGETPQHSTTLTCINQRNKVRARCEIVLILHPRPSAALAVGYPPSSSYGVG